MKDCFNLCICWLSSELLLVFGPKKLPELGKGIGEGIRGFKTAMHGEEQAPAAREQQTSSSNTESSPTSTCV